MHVKNYRAKSAEQCIQKLKADLGRDAVILQSRTVRRYFGKFGPTMHEIVAASDAESLLDKFSTKAVERELQRAAAPPRVGIGERDGGAALDTRLSLSSGNPPQSVRAAAPAASLPARGRLTLAEAAALAERGELTPARAVELGIIAPQPSLAAALPAAGLARPSAPPPVAAAPPAGSDERLLRLERQIEALAAAMTKPVPVPVPQTSAATTTVTVDDALASAVPAGGRPAEPPASDPPNARPAAAGARPAFLRHRLQPEVVAPQMAATPVPVPPRPAAAPAPDAYQPLMDLLRSACVADGLVRHIRAEMPDGAGGEEARAALHNIIARRFLTCGGIAATPGKITLAALLGPTGVGKTTTIAKLAANLALGEGRRVGMVTLDTQRVAAIQQLATYGDILGVPVKVAYDRAEMERILEEFALAGMEIVLIDTPGRGPAETLSLAEMSASLRATIDLNTYLVLPATLSQSNFEHTIVRFTKLASPSGVILTKMDETADNHCLGFLLNAQAKHRIPLAYVTMGARVPDDLLGADAHVLASKLLTSSMMS